MDEILILGGSGNKSGDIYTAAGVEAEECDTVWDKIGYLRRHQRKVRRNVGRNVSSLFAQLTSYAKTEEEAIAFREGLEYLLEASGKRKGY